jgi:nitrate reductase NapAB chaperone NapD
MPVLGAVLTLSGDAALRGEALATLAADGRVTLGDPVGDRLPVVLDTRSRGEDRACWEAVSRLPGVVLAELAFADFSDLHESQEGAP